MTKPLLVVAAILLGLTLPYSKAQEVTPSALSITISMANGTISLGSPVLVLVSLRNRSTDALTVARANGSGQANFNYRITVYDNDGHPVPGISAPRRKNGFQPPLAWSNIGVKLGPGDTMDENCDLTKLFNFTSAGKYKVQFARNAPLDTSKTIRSNLLEFYLEK